MFAEYSEENEYQAFYPEVQTLAFGYNAHLVHNLYAIYDLASPYALRWIVMLK